MLKRRSLAVFFCTLIISFSSLFAIDNSILLDTPTITMGEENFMRRIYQCKPEREPLGLVLCGGSVRAYAHIGVLREMEKANVKPDFIVASSIGAIIGTLYASGFSPDDIENLISSVDLTMFFKMVQPDINGYVHSPYFDELIANLFPGKEFDLKNTTIPILIPTKDIPSKDILTQRSILYTEGNIIDIMRDTFYMSYMMEPVNVGMDESNLTRMEDSGNTDLWTLSIAEKYSRNLLVSTSLYNPVKKKNNITVISNSFIIGEERSLSGKLIQNNYHWIRTDMDDFSFADYTDVKEIIARGEKGAQTYFSTHKIKDSEKFSDFLFERPDFSNLRSLRHQYCTKVIGLAQKFQKQNKKTNKVKLPVTENSKGVELKDFFFSEHLSSGLYTFFDFRPLYLKTGIKANFFTFWAPDSKYLSEIKTTLNSDLLDFSLNDSFFNKIKEHKFTFGTEVKREFLLFNLFSLQPYITGETSFYYSNYILSDKIFYDQKFMGRGGVIYKNQDQTLLSLYLNPYLFFYTEDMNCKFMDHIGMGGKLSTDFTAIPHLGFKFSDSFRFQEKGEGIIIFQNDDYRGECPSDKPQVNNSSYLNLLQMELFWYTKTKVSAMEKIKLEKIKVGAFYDYMIFENGLEHSAGIFIRPQILLIASNSVMNMELFAGFDTSEDSSIFGFSFTQNW